MYFSFPITAPMNILHVNIYAVGVELTLDVNKHYLVAACTMASFSVAVIILLSPDPTLSLLSNSSILH